MTFDLSKCVRDPETGFLMAQTRDGRKVRIYATDGEIENGRPSYPIHGAIEKESGGWSIWTWTSTGSASSDPEYKTDLINPPETFERVVWVNVYQDGSDDPKSCTFHSRKDMADLADRERPCNRRIACLCLTIKGHVGEGLEDKPGL